MTEIESAREWAKFYKASVKSYRPHALSAPLLNGGPRMLALVLKELKLERSVDLVSDWHGEEATRGPQQAAGEVEDT